MHDQESTQLHLRSQQDLRDLGNWNPQTQKARYSCKVPPDIVRRKAGHKKGAGCHYNPHTTCDPPQELLKLVFPWVDSRFEQFTAHSPEYYGNERETATAFFHFIFQMRKFVLQDVAAMLVKDGSRIQHRIFQLDAFQSPLFAQYVSKMRKHLNDSESPDDTKLEQVTPTINTRMIDISV